MPLRNIGVAALAAIRGALAYKSSVLRATVAAAERNFAFTHRSIGLLKTKQHGYSSKLIPTLLIIRVYITVIYTEHDFGFSISLATQ